LHAPPAPQSPAAGAPVAAPPPPPPQTFVDQLSWYKLSAPFSA
jgi:hypothetical protein